MEIRPFVDAGAEAMAAYTADQHIRTMTAGTVATQLQPFLGEMRQMFAAHERRIDERFVALERRMDRRFDGRDRRFDEQGCKLDAIGARLDELIALAAFMVGGLVTLNLLLIGMFIVLLIT